MTMLICVAGCVNDDNKIDGDTRISPPEPGKDLREGYEAPQNVKIAACMFDNPDTSLSGIKLRDAESATTILKTAKLEGDTVYHFLNKDNTENLTIAVHPGDNYSQVGVFRLEYISNPDTKGTALAIGHFATEKNIKLGLSKRSCCQTRTLLYDN